jgi:hypothetical protein
MANNNNNLPEGEVLSETENFFVWRSEEEDGYVYHIELGGVSLHLIDDEWDELMTLVKGA